MRRLAAPLCIAAVVLLYWIASWTTVATLLTRDAEAQLEFWVRGATPWQWNFSFADSVVWPGSSGFSRSRLALGPLVGRLPRGNADLSLELRGRGVDLSLIDHAVIRAHPNTAMQAQLIAQTPAGPLVLGAAPLADRDRPTTISFENDTIATALRLHLNSAPNASITLRSLQLWPRPGVAPEECPAAATQTCLARVPVIDGPGSLSPESLLDWRDRLLRERPAAIVRAPASAPTATAFEATLRTSLSGATGWFLIALPLLGSFASYARRSTLTRVRAALELTAVFSPWLLLQWVGVDPDDSWTPKAYFAYWCAFAAAVSIRNPTPNGRFFGTAPAWRATGQFVLVAVLVVGATALANALDTDGFALRPLESDMFWRYPVWALAQQWIILRAIAPRMHTLFSSELAAALATGALFGLLHVPNFALMLATFAAGACWAWLGYRHRALLPLALSHTGLGLALFSVASSWLLRSAEVGARFLMAP